MGAFEKRKANDEAGVTEARRKAREKEAAERAALEKEIKEVLDEGGVAVKVPIVEKVKGKERVVGMRKGAVLVKRGMSKKNNPYLEVVRVVGIEDVIAPGATSPVDGRSFPYHVREALKGKGMIEER